MLVAGFAFGGVGGKLGLGRAQQPDLGGDLGGQASEVDSGVAVVQLQGGLRGVEPLAGPVGAWWPWEALAITWVSSACPTPVRARGSA